MRKLGSWRNPFRIEFEYTLNWRDTEVDATVTAEITPACPPSWGYSGGDPGWPDLVEILEVWVDISDDGDSPEEISGNLSTETIAELEEAALDEAENNSYDGPDTIEEANGDR